MAKNLAITFPPFWERQQVVFQEEKIADIAEINKEPSFERTVHLRRGGVKSTERRVAAM
jgi:hypothetical protein